MDRPQAAGQSGEETRQVGSGPNLLAKEGLGGVIVIADLTTSVGSGSFVVGNEFSRNPYFDYAVTLQPIYEFKNKLQVDLLLSGVQELTESDSTTENRQFLLSDLRLGMRRRLHAFEQSKTSITGELYSHLPTSLVSRGETLVTALEARANLIQPWGDFTFWFRTAFRKNFHEYTSPVVETQETGLAGCLARDGGNERIDALTCTAGGNNVSHGLNNRLLVAYAPLEKLSFAGIYTLGHSFTYDGYEATSEACDVTNPASCASGGTGATSGRGRRDTQAGQLMSFYQAAPNLMFTLGISTVSSPRTADDQGIRFPFLDTRAQESNLTTYFLSVTLTEPFAFSKESEEAHAKITR